MKRYQQTSECFRHPHLLYSSLPDKPWKKATLSLHLGHFAENFLEKILLFDKPSLLNLLSAFCWDIHFSLPATIPALRILLCPYITYTSAQKIFNDSINEIQEKNTQYPGWISVIKWTRYFPNVVFIQWKGTRGFARLRLTKLTTFRGKAHRDNIILVSSFLEDFLDFLSNITKSTSIADITSPTPVTWKKTPTKWKQRWKGTCRRAVLSLLRAILHTAILLGQKT